MEVLPTFTMASFADFLTVGNAWGLKVSSISSVGYLHWLLRLSLGYPSDSNLRRSYRTF